MAKQESGTAQSKKTMLWRERMARFKASGRQVAEFCNSESVSEASFYRWRKQLCAAVDAPGTTARFIDAGALAPAVAPAASAHQGTPELEVRLELGHGLVLHIVRR